MFFLKISFVLLIISSVLRIGLGVEFECPGNADCTCSSGVSGDFDLVCPSVSQSPKLIAQIEPGKYVKIQCTEPNNWEEMRLLSGINIGPVNSFTICLCPLPGTSFKELITSVGITAIQALQVTSYGNLSNTLTRRHLEGLNDITRLDLSTNYLTELPEDLFQEVTNLTRLDLRNNNVKLPKTIFRYLPRLDVLELGSNNLSYLEPGIFRNLRKLRLLNLWGNKLKNLSRSLFSDVTNLETLDLSSNGLNNLAPDLFADLPNLRDVNLLGNNFTSLPQGLFLSNTNLERVQIQNNRGVLSLLPSALFANLTQLKNLSLQNGKIKIVSEDLLAGSISLATLALQRNLIETLPQDFLKDNAQLENINLAFNKIKYLPDQLFQSTGQLKQLYLSNNAITNLTGQIFSSLNNLEVLDLSNNQIEYISQHTFEKTVSLKTINLSYNKITKFGSEYPGLTFGPPSILQSSIRLEALYLAHNSISQLYSDWIISMTQLQILDLSYNRLQNLSYSELHSVVASKLTVNLTSNEITYIDMDQAEELAIDKLGLDWKINQYYSKVQVLLKENPIICDCHAYDFVNYFRDKYSPQVRSVVDFDSTDLYCTGENFMSGESVRNVDPRFLICNLPEPCAGNCTCSIRPDDRALIVNCFERGFDLLPSSMPSNDDIQNIELITNHTELDLRHNRLETMPTILGPGYDRVTKMNLGYNSITQLNSSSFPPHLQELNLDNNNLTRMDYSLINKLKNISSLKNLRLTNNPWICDCEVMSFIDFIFNNVDKVPLVKNITCMTGVLLTSIKGSDVCPNAVEYFTITSIAIAALGLIFGAIATLYYRFQREIKVWLYAHRMCLCFVTEDELDKDKQYDAFISFSSLDESFIIDKLVPMLENGPTKYKLCLHYRDWIVGEFIPTQIARSVDNSRRTVVVLSPNFLESVWGRMEFRAAHSQALSEGRARVIVILYGDVGPTENLDPELKAYLSMNTYVKWGDPWFWDKLRYALPHPTELSKGIQLIKRQPGRKRQKLISQNEKLINGADNNINNTSSTPPVESIIADPLKLIDSKRV